MDSAWSEHGYDFDITGHCKLAHAAKTTTATYYGISDHQASRPNIVYACHMCLSTESKVCSAGRAMGITATERTQRHLVGQVPRQQQHAAICCDIVRSALLFPAGSYTSWMLRGSSQLVGG